MAKVRIDFGKKITPRQYQDIPLGATVGKTIEAIGTTTVEGAEGNEPCTILFFTDKTRHGFVHPAR